MASTWKLPVVYVCENNLYAVTTPISRVTNIENLADRAVAYGIPGVTVDGMDVLAVYQAAQEAVKRARAGEGPSLLECKTYRFEGHGMGDVQFYRTEEEIKEWKKRDPIPRLESYLKSESILSDKAVKEIREKVRLMVEEAVDFAKNSPEPGPETLMEGLFTPSTEEQRQEAWT
jgi:pyruvate dehydrogenase E1 component alpha subunit